MADAPNPHDQALEKAASGEIPSFYLNGFSTGLSNGDISTVLILNGQPAAVVNMSFTIAKTLSIALANTVNHLEVVAETKILTTNDIDAKLEAYSQKTNKARASDMAKEAE